jgi:hypothetical protein
MDRAWLRWALDKPHNTFNPIDFCTHQNINHAPLQEPEKRNTWWIIENLESRIPRLIQKLQPLSTISNTVPETSLQDTIILPNSREKKVHYPSRSNRTYFIPPLRLRMHLFKTVQQFEPKRFHRLKILHVDLVDVS